MATFHVTEVFDAERREVWGKLKAFRHVGVLAGGTALALQLGHRKSFDFAIFCKRPISSRLLRETKKVFDIRNVLVNNSDELTFQTRENVKVTFLYYPFHFSHKPIFCEGFSLLHAKDIAASKAYALNRRPSFKDYVDLSFLLKSGLSLKSLLKDSRKIYGTLFSEKLFLAQLIYLEDLDPDELQKIQFVGKQKVTKKELAAFFKKLVRA